MLLSCSQVCGGVCRGFEGTERNKRICVSVVLNKDINLYNCKRALAQKNYMIPPESDMCDTASVVDWLHGSNRSDQFADYNTAT